MVNTHNSIPTAASAPRSPTSYLWAFRLRRDFENVVARVDGLAKRVEALSGEMEEVKGLLRGLDGRVEVCEGGVREVEGRVAEMGKRRRVERGDTVEQPELSTGLKTMTRLDLSPLLAPSQASTDSAPVAASEAEAEIDDRPRGSAAMSSPSASSEIDGDALYDEIDALQQGDQPLNLYIDRAESLLQRAPIPWERFVVDSFVAGMTDEHERETVEGVLENEDGGAGWTWERAREVVSGMAVEKKPKITKRKRRKRKNW